MIHPHINQAGGWRRFLISTLLIIIAIFACGLVTLFGIDMTCNNNINNWLPLYPDAEVVSVEHNYFRPRAMGQTMMVLRTSDAHSDVTRWYLDQRVGMAQQMTNRGLATTQYRAVADPDSDETLIYLMSECAYN